MAKRKTDIGLERTGAGAIDSEHELGVGTLAATASAPEKTRKKRQTYPHIIASIRPPAIGENPHELLFIVDAKPIEFATVKDAEKAIEDDKELKGELAIIQVKRRFNIKTETVTRRVRELV